MFLIGRVVYVGNAVPSKALLFGRPRRVCSTRLLLRRRKSHELKHMDALNLIYMGRYMGLEKPARHAR